MTDDLDDLAAKLGVDLTPPDPGPEYVYRLCNYNNCTVQLEHGRIVAVAGPVGCPCDNTRGWNARYLEQMGKPHPPVKSRHWKVRRREREIRNYERFWRDMYRPPFGT